MGVAKACEHIGRVLTDHMLQQASSWSPLTERVGVAAARRVVCGGMAVSVSGDGIARCARRGWTCLFVCLFVLLVRGCGRWGSNSYGQLLHHGSTAISPVELTQAMLGFNPSDIRSIQAGTSGASCGIAVLCTCLCVFGDSDSTSLNCTRVH